MLPLPVSLLRHTLAFSWTSPSRTTFPTTILNHSSKCMPSHAFHSDTEPHDADIQILGSMSYRLSTNSATSLSLPTYVSSNSYIPNFNLSPQWPVMESPSGLPTQSSPHRPVLSTQTPDPFHELTAAPLQPRQVHSC